MSWDSHPLFDSARPGNRLSLTGFRTHADAIAVADGSELPGRKLRRSKGRTSAEPVGAHARPRACRLLLSSRGAFGGGHGHPGEGPVPPTNSRGFLVVRTLPRGNRATLVNSFLPLENMPSWIPYLPPRDGHPRPSCSRRSCRAWLNGTSSVPDGDVSSSTTPWSDLPDAEDIVESAITQAATTVQPPREIP